MLGRLAHTRPPAALGGACILIFSTDSDFWSCLVVRRCLECLATEPSACLKVELRLMTEKWEEAEIQTQEAVEDKEAVDDGVGSEYRL